MSEIFIQLVICDQCGESLFEIAEMYEKDICIKCGKCGATFTIYAEKADETIVKTLLQEQVRDRLKLSELLEIRLHTFESQIGGYGSGAATLFQNYIETLFDAVIESVDDMVLQKLQSLFFRRIKNEGISEGPALLDDIETAAQVALERSGYELEVDGKTEIEDD